MNVDTEVAAEFALLDSLSTAVLVLDHGLFLRYMNTAAEQLLGHSRQGILGRRLNQVVNLPDALLTRLRTALENAQPFSDRQVSMESPGHDPVLVDCSITPYRQADQPNALLLEITVLDRPMRIARDEAVRTQQEHARSLLRGLAHEIKNPLGGLRGAAQLLDKQVQDSELHEYTSIIIGEADRLHNLIERMLGPNTRPRRELLNIHEVLEHVRKISRVGASPAVEFRIDYDPSIPEFSSDRDRIVQVLLNIAGNAVNAVGENGTIVFRSRVISSYTIAGTRHPLVAAIEIRDNGPGIPAGMQEQIFFPMVSGQVEGTGLGLSIAQSIMNQLGGFIECRSEPGDTAFSVMIPLEIA